MPDVSFVIPTISEDRWLDEAVSSAINQDSHADIQIIVAYDGPVAESQRPWKSHPRVRVLRASENRGLARTLNWAISHADSEFIARLDADDRSRPDRISKQLAAFEAFSDAVLVGSPAVPINSDGEPLSSQERKEGEGPEIDRNPVVVNPVLGRRNLLVHSSVMFRRDAFNSAGGYREDLRQMEDYELWLRLAGQGDVVRIPEKLVDYRLHANQMTRSGSIFDRHLYVVAWHQFKYNTKARGNWLGGAAHSFVWLAAQLAAVAGLRKRRYDKQ